MPAQNSNRTHGILYESEAALRLVDNELNAFEGSHDATAVEPAAPVAEPQPDLSGFADLATVLGRANAQIVALLGKLREERAAIQHTASVRVTQDKLREVSSTTEDAATNIMDACDRATVLVDELDEIEHDALPDRGKAALLRGSLRDELFHMMGALQFQDITSQQLAHASAVLEEMEQRMLEVAKLFDPVMTPEASNLPVKAPHGNVAYDPSATIRNADIRQALADDIFKTIKGPAA